MNYFFGSTTAPKAVPTPEPELDIESEESTSIPTKKLSYNIIRGKMIKETTKFCTKQIYIENLIQLYNKKYIIIPEFQRLVDQEKINSMIETYKKNPDYFNFLTNPIQLVKLTDDDATNLILLDGQHRLFMYMQLYLKSINGEIYINIINCSTVTEMLEIFNNCNYDNKNIHFAFDEILEIQSNARYIVLRDQLHKLYKKYFKQTDDNIYGIEEFVKILQYHEYLQYFNNVSDALLFMLERNDMFHTTYYIKLDIEKFLKKEKDLILNGKIFSLKKNNFIEFLMSNDSDIHLFEYKHVIIKKRTKNTV